MLRDVIGGEVSRIRRQESVCGLAEASIAVRRVIFSGSWGQRRVRNGFMIMLVPVWWTHAVESSSSPLAVGSR